MTGRGEPGAPPPAPEEVGLPGDEVGEGAQAGEADVGAGAQVGEAATEEDTGTILTDVAALAAERDEYLIALQRLKADFDNYRKRVLRQQEEQTARAEGSLVAKLLPVLDNLDLAWVHLAGGTDGGDEEARAIGQARTQLLDVLGKEGLERVDAAEVPFDPQVHDAVAHAPAAGAEMGGAVGTEGSARGGEGGPASAQAGAEGVTGPARSAEATVVVDEIMRAGYRWRGQVLRPAMVRVRG